MTSFGRQRPTPAGTDEAAVRRALSSAGVPLTPDVRKRMELRLGAPLDAVEIHGGQDAAASATQLGVRAYAYGSHVVFGAGEYAPESASGDRLLAHELAHVVQQGTGPAPPVGSPDEQVRTRSGAAELEASAASSAAVPEGGRVQPRPGSRPWRVQGFDSFEHIDLGDSSLGGPSGRILLGCHARDLPGHAHPVVGWPPDWVARYEKGTSEQRKAITEGLTYGEILAMAGDMYAAVDPATGRTSVPASMERINKASLVEIYDLIPLLWSRDTGTAALEVATGGRYISLAAKNLSHFSNVDSGRGNLAVWREGHAAALALAAAGDSAGAWAMNAAADHFLTDAFSAGHLRVNRATDMRTKPGQVASKARHDLDNEYGVAVENARGDRWVAYGDDHLGDDARGRSLVLEAVALSKGDVHAVLDAVQEAAGRISVLMPTAPYPSEQLVPVPRPEAPARWSLPQVAAEGGHLAVTELPEQLVPNGDTRAREWVRRQPASAVRDMPLDEKTRMVNRLLSGWVSDDDLSAVERLYRESGTSDRTALSAVIAPQITDLNSIGQRTRLRVLLEL